MAGRALQPTRAALSLFVRHALGCSRRHDAIGPRRNLEFGAAVSAPARLRRVRAHWPLLAKTHDVNSPGIDPVVHEVPFGRGRPPLPKREIVFVRASFIRVPGDAQANFDTRAEQGKLCVEDEPA